MSYNQVINTQLEYKTRILEYFLKDRVTNADVANYMNELQLPTLENKLRGNAKLTKQEVEQILEVLKNINHLFRIYGKKSDGLEEYIRSLK
ncbi:hypothetical protein A2473_03440 [candidate division WWE3 bacterium RIFOXYC2_FULL_42_13]|uniref:Uncharacterized protein n=1 Tax=candidate division WWE3 bacterium TaxID=2053526 RepID=A0A3D0ZSB7_UNCKA|nr:MAG: hypothetical protein A2245_01595 [candidate division WWE3 bacterium RIFOXYA2_FULL_43_12]OGC65635.1 MAG: hypothetical protein A2274_02835 [candidate division WWE3 bacterium RIFOXYA12_FULL_43_11]OGC71547.1 MAG: hypothetical protein A2337_01675 [candidate division WWE3 bacterium RIFOXYB2_FULL_43_9]OGC73914.1 MAG: hypothetical protein A2473_03440 [candidate division WWE3 bacterium RIFOXYC2_FULL_42_13]OGC75048.1 MAG: hypothetical protein A2547_01065 [candidate division WWE3 bacterium RIFOXYD